jgi:hypothetical protein
MDLPPFDLMSWAKQNWFAELILASNRRNLSFLISHHKKGSGILVNDSNSQTKSQLTRSQRVFAPRSIVRRVLRALCWLSVTFSFLKMRIAIPVVTFTSSYIMTSNKLLNPLNLLILGKSFSCGTNTKASFIVSIRANFSVQDLKEFSFPHMKVLP